MFVLFLYVEFRLCWKRKSSQDKNFTFLYCELPVLLYLHGSSYGQVYYKNDTITISRTYRNRVTCIEKSQAKVFGSPKIIA
jgi:hypothetical protein